jgi:hypothetical protein
MDLALIACDHCSHQENIIFWMSTSISVNGAVTVNTILFPTNRFNLNQLRETGLETCVALFSVHH